MEFFKFHAIIYVHHVLYTLKKNLVFFYSEKKNSRWTSSSLVVVHSIDVIMSTVQIRFRPGSITLVLKDDHSTTLVVFSIHLISIGSTSWRQNLLRGAINMTDRDEADAPNSSTSPSPSSSSAKKRGRSSTGSSSGHQDNRMMRSITAEQTHIQLKHYHVESFWNKVAAEMNEIPPGII